VALLFGLVVFMALTAPVLLYMTDLGADALVAVFSAATSIGSSFIP
jgi:hypothetical protein